MSEVQPNADLDYKDSASHPKSINNEKQILPDVNQTNEKTPDGKKPFGSNSVVNPVKNNNGNGLPKKTEQSRLTGKAGESQIAKKSASRICCCSLSTALIIMTVVDLCTGLFCFGWLLFVLTYYRTDGPGIKYSIIGLSSATLITILSIALLVATIKRSMKICWISHAIVWAIFLACGVLYCYLTAAQGYDLSLWDIVELTALGVAFLYRIYESVVVYKFVKSPPPWKIEVQMQEPYYRGIPGGTFTIYPPPTMGAQYVPVGGYNYSPLGHPYYIGGYGGFGGRYYGMPVYSYGPGLSMGLGLGYGMYGPFDDYYGYGWY